jgi:DNA primase catalytic subunit
MEKRGFRFSSLEERKKFYEKEFDITKVKKWFRKNKLALPQICAVDAGSDTGIIVDKKMKGSMFYFSFFELEEKIKKYAPEDVYYDRNKYEDYRNALDKLNFRKWKEQELVFDVDADNIKCNHPKKSFVCNVCLKKAYNDMLKITELLREKYLFDKIIVNYSGRGFHIHVLDRRAFRMSIEERRKLTQKFSKFAIDPWVSRGYISLIRMPFSLNGLVSRIATPVNLNKEINYGKSIPKFLKSN